MEFSKICEFILTTLYLTAQFDMSKQNYIEKAEQMVQMAG